MLLFSLKLNNNESLGNSINNSKLKSFFTNNFNITARNIGIVFGATSIANVINFFYNIIIGRVLGPSEYGILATMISLLYISGAITGTIHTSSTRFAAALKAESNFFKIKRLLNLITIRFLIFTSLIFLLLLIFLKPITNFLNLQNPYPLIVLGVIMVIGSAIAIGRGIIQGLERFKQLSFISIIEVLLKLGLSLLLVYLGLKAFGAILGIMLSILISYFLIFFFIRDIIKLKPDVNSVDNDVNIKDFYVSIFLILISTILLALVSFFDIVLVKHFFSSQETGYYSAAAQIGRIILFLPGAVSIVVFPRFTEKFIRKENIIKTFLKSFLIIFLISASILLIYYFFPEFIIKTIYGKKYITSSVLLFKYGIFIMFISFINLQALYFISIKKYWYLICLFVIFIFEILLIFNFHKTLNMVLWIIILNSFIIFLVNIFLMFFPKNKKPFTGVNDERKDFSINTGF